VRALGGWGKRTFKLQTFLKSLPPKIFGFVFFEPRPFRARSARHTKNALAFLAPHQGKPIPKCILSRISFYFGVYIQPRSNVFRQQSRLMRTRRVRGGFDPQRTLRSRGNPATRGVPRVPPLALPLVSILFFRWGEFKKGMGGKGEGRRLISHHLHFSTGTSTRLFFLSS
jgi:hypothetical protein